MALLFDPYTQQYVNVPDPYHIRVPFLQHQVPAGDAAAAAIQAMGGPAPCQPCEERKRWLNQRVVFDPWRT